jgi:hypothetical protein
MLRRPPESAMGWKNVIIDGTAWWVPPSWIDPRQAPIRKDQYQLR